MQTSNALRFLATATNVFKRDQYSKMSQHQAEVMAKGLPKRAPLPGVGKIVIVASGKGGVGKSTASVNIAVTLAQMGKRVGLLDADIFGPTIPLMMNLNDTPLIDENNSMIPLQNYGVKWYSQFDSINSPQIHFYMRAYSLSMGFLIDPNKPIIWRGPLVMSALQRLLRGAIWSPLDILIVDTPPGTGDIHLSLSQNVPISGVVLVSTPQRAALDVTKRGAEMYRTLKVPLIGIVENMSHVICSNCTTKIEIYPQKIHELSKELNVDVLGSIPIDRCLADCADSGTPIVVKDPNSIYAEEYRIISGKIYEFLNPEKNIK